MGELALARVHAADEDVEDEVAQLVVVEPLPVGLRRDQVGDQILARVVATLGDQLVTPRVELRHRRLDPWPVLRQAGCVELPLDQV